MSRIFSDLLVTGNFQSDTMTLPQGCVSDNNVAPNASIQASKLINRYRKSYQADVPAAGTFCLHVVESSAGAILNSFIFGARVVDPSSSDTSNLVLDLRQNGVSILQGHIPIVFTSVGYSPSAWSSGSYTVGNVVTNAGSTYICIGDVTSSLPPGSDTAHWLKVANSTITASGGTGGSSYAFQTLAPTAADLNQYDWIDFCILSVFTGTGGTATPPQGIFASISLDESPLV